MLMTFGKWRGGHLDQVDNQYLRWAIANCTNLDPCLRTAIETELQARQRATVSRRGLAYREAKARLLATMHRTGPGDMIDVAHETFRVLVEAEDRGDFHRGPALDRLWELLAATHAELEQRTDTAKKSRTIAAAAMGWSSRN